MKAGTWPKGWSLRKEGDLCSPLDMSTGWSSNGMSFSIRHAATRATAGEIAGPYTVTGADIAAPYGDLSGRKNRWRIGRREQVAARRLSGVAHICFA